MSSDLATVDAVITALYESTHHTREKPQDWERFRSLFVPNAVLVQAASIGSYEYTVDSYVEEARYFRDRDPAEEWYETEVARETHQLGDVAHVFSVSVFGPDAERPQAKRHTNSFHLVKTDEYQQHGTSFHRTTAWRITSWHWSAELPPTTRINPCP
jgi:hypothetical protein